MALSQNGWPAFTDYGQAGLTSNPTVPGSDVKILGGVRSGATLTVLLYAASRWHSEVEPLVQDLGQWGFGPRDIRGSTELSNHASGTAVDLNAVKHPLGADPAASFSADQIFTIRRICSDLGGVIRWGGDYYGRKDGMHLEINSGPGQVEAMAAKIRAGTLPGVHPDLLDQPPVIEVKPAPPQSKPAPTDWLDMATEAQLRKIVREEIDAALDAALATDERIANPKTGARQTLGQRILGIQAGISALRKKAGV